jgi:hypothetical protein
MERRRLDASGRNVPLLPPPSAPAAAMVPQLLQKACLESVGAFRRSGSADNSSGLVSQSPDESAGGSGQLAMGEYITSVTAGNRKFVTDPGVYGRHRLRFKKTKNRGPRKERFRYTKVKVEILSS